MTEHRWRDYDDGFDESSLFEDQSFEETADLNLRPILRAVPTAPRTSNDENSRARGDEASVRRKFAYLNAWGAPY